MKLSFQEQKETLGGASIISLKKSTSDITINDPTTGDITCELKAADFTGLTAGWKYIGACGVKSDGEEEIFEITENGRLIEQVEFITSPVTST